MLPGKSGGAERARNAARYLFLQGPIGPFFADLARRLRPDGDGIHRINLSGGDSVWWNVAGSVTVDFRGTQAAWPDFLRGKLTDWGITDLVLFGDCRPIHREAIRLARMRALRVHVFEEGYLRPDWVTLEEGGVNRNSSLPRDPAWYLASAKETPDEEAAWPVPASFSRRAAEDVLYTLSLTLQHWRFPGYRTHKPWHPLVEYRAGAKRFFLKGAMRRRGAGQCAQVLAERRPFFLFPLQLHADAQIRFHSPFGTMAAAVEEVIASFANRAPADSLLVLTEHPLDNGVIDLEAIAMAAARSNGIADRVRFIRGGSPDALLRAARGVVTVNSTIGIVALGLGRPVALLGDAIYNMPGLVFQGPLDRFWHGGTPADRPLYEAFRRIVLARTQVNGGYYSLEGRRLAVEGAARRLLSSPGVPVTITRTMPQVAELPADGVGNPEMRV